MSGTASELSWEIISQKLKYAQKVLSDKSIESNMDSIFSMLDFLSFSFDFTLSDTLFSSLLSSILFGIPFSSIAPVLLDFNIELPTVDEFLKGLLIKIEPVNIYDKYPELLTLSLSFYNIFDKDVASTLLTQQLEKGVFGLTKYGMSYYDPTPLGEFIRSTLYALTKKRSTDETVKRRVEASSKTLGINMDLASYIFNSMQMLYYAKTNACSADYCWFDVTTFPNEGSEAKISFVGWDLQPVEADYSCITDASGSCWFDNCLFDLNLFAPDEAPTIYIDERAGNLITEVSYYMYQRARSRLLTTPLALSNYQKTEERMEPSRSIRLETYGLNRYITEDIRRTVKSIIKDRVPYPIIQNLYADAILDLIKRLTKPGGWGDESFRVMSRDELLNYLVEKWGSQGLDRNVLEYIFNYMYDAGIINRYAFIRYQNKYTVKTARGGS